MVISSPPPLLPTHCSQPDGPVVGRPGHCAWLQEQCLSFLCLAVGKTTIDGGAVGQQKERSRVCYPCAQPVTPL